MWNVYFLELSNQHVYVGHTHDLRQRISAHETGEILSTKGLRPVKLRSYVAVEGSTCARELEQYFQSGSGKAVARKRFLRDS